MKQLKRFLGLSVFILFLVLFSVPFESLNAQHIDKMFEDIGGGGGSSNRSEDSGSGNTMYIVGGVLIAGVLLYALLRDKKEPEKKDTTVDITNQEFLVPPLSWSQDIDGSQSQIPLNFIAGAQNSFIVKEEKRYFFGISYSF